MPTFFQRIDELNDLTSEKRGALWLERLTFIFLTLMVLCAPHSIAATQSAWLLGMLAWFVRLFFKPRPKFKLMAIDYALAAFFLWSVVSSALSYAPGVSLDKLRGVSLFLIFYFVYYNLKTARAARFLAFALIFSACVSAAWMPLERIVGRGVEVRNLSPASPLLKAARIDEGLPISEGKTVVQVGKKKIYSPETLLAEIQKNETSRLLIYHEDFYSTVEVRRADLLSGASAAEKLGIGSWERNHNWRAAGFYGHFTTYAEVTQLILSLVFGILVSLLSSALQNKSPIANHKSQILLLGSATALMSLALLLTVTRASQFAFFISAVVIVLLGAHRKIRIVFAAVALPLIVVGMLYYQQTRGIGFNLQDKSTQYRTMMWRDGARLLTTNAHNLVFGVGMDSIKTRWREWDLFDGGREPMGHFHSTPVQIAVERGMPALLIWLAVLAIFARKLFLKVASRKPAAGIQTEEKSAIRKAEGGILLGCLGALAGFFTSGLVHYNLGDGEVAMVFYLLMGIGIFVGDLKQANEPAS